VRAGHGWIGLKRSALGSRRSAVGSESGDRA
jgi:hypothetical protein